VILDEEICEFVTSGVSIMLASRNSEFGPSLARAMGCRIIQGAAPKLRVFASSEQAGELLDDVRMSGMISATFSRPNTHRALQFKGRDAVIGAVNEQDKEVVGAYVLTFAEVIRPFGFSSDFARAFFACSGDEVAIEFTPSDAYQQTPGPDAGVRLT
jgi:hypothetical protein